MYSTLLVLQLGIMFSLDLPCLNVDIPYLQVYF